MRCANTISEWRKACCSLKPKEHTDPARPEPPDNSDALISACTRSTAARSASPQESRQKAVILSPAGTHRRRTLLWAMSEMMRKPPVLAEEGAGRRREGCGGRGQQAVRGARRRGQVNETLRLHLPAGGRRYGTSHFRAGCAGTTCRPKRGCCGDPVSWAAADPIQAFHPGRSGSTSTTAARNLSRCRSVSAPATTSQCSERPESQASRALAGEPERR